MNQPLEVHSLPIYTHTYIYVYALNGIRIELYNILAMKKFRQIDFCQAIYIYSYTKRTIINKSVNLHNGITNNIARDMLQDKSTRIYLTRKTHLKSITNFASTQYMNSVVNSLCAIKYFA